MKIRNKITIWITGAGLLAALFFSCVIFFELIEQPFELLDRDLERHALIVTSSLFPKSGVPPSRLETEPVTSRDNMYWIKVFDQNLKKIYASISSRIVDIPLKPDDRYYNFRPTAPAQATDLTQDRHTKTIFRVCVLTVPYKGGEYLVQIARPMEKLWEEIVELLLTIGAGLLVFTFALVVIGYYVAGKILEPIATINTLARKISDKTLDRRIPPRGNQDEIHALSTSLNQMFDRLQFSFQRQKEFIANASHELKTPITLLRLFFDEAIQNEQLPESFKTRLTSQSEAVFRMNQLVKNLLDLSILEFNNTLEPEIVDLSELTSSIFEEFQDIIQNRDINLSLDITDNVHLLADKEKIRRVLINLIDNAIKYNLKEKGEILFSLHRKNDFIVMNISNTGQTIPEDELEAVFDQFHRVEKSRSKALGGSGLGLTIARQIVELHHGTISIPPPSHPANRVLVEIRLPQKWG
ncbi:sensor histidine kinase [Desulforhopalus singaporensis]|uniref:histidine kinase n=1 Tax=Desulforhopalus singaporensis TaxID=91360 RepID=A0A1H0KT89_9BACT|nr:HAMP domain-containing sensor histidine kinase [Desulforhopalus singaporensis]SDO59178.1 Signal transduction histidine kinase [Desulforhopalus singaporensis]